MTSAYILDIVRTPVGKYAGSLAQVRPDDLAAIAIKALLERNPGLDPSQVEDVIFGAANQAGEDNRNVARMAGLLAGLPVEVGGVTVNRLCASGLQSIMDASRAVMLNEADVALVPGSAFGAPGYIRLSFACSLAELQDALGRMKRAVTA